MKKAAALGLTLLLLWTLLLNIYHMGALPKPVIPAGEQGSAEFLPRETHGLHHLIVRGTPYTRGLEGGRLTQPLMLLEEQALIGQLQQWIPQTWLLKSGVAGLITYFHGADKFISQDDLLEIYGTSKSSPVEFDFVADSYTRGLAYHGLHEVGQMMVDSGFDMGCTVVAVPQEKGWILGRNFDFEGGRVFDEEKVVKWVFPDKGYAHVSIVWAGMVGAVTGVNEKGVYISINAAGSEDRRRLGTPSTLVAYKILREAATADEAVAILRAARMFITDIFVVGDTSGKMLKVEKSPQKMEVIEASGPFVVTNHLTGPAFEADKINSMRMEEQTSVAREARAMDLASKIRSDLSAEAKSEKILEVLRDKGADGQGRPLHLGNRRAIDALIATHSVIWDSTRGVLFVSQGPSLSGKFLGYDLARSFEAKKPVEAGELPADSAVPQDLYRSYHDAMATIRSADQLRRQKKCQEAENIIYTVPEGRRQHSRFFHVLGDIQKCFKLPDRAELAWARAYELRPAYAKDKRDLETKLNLTPEQKF